MSVRKISWGLVAAMCMVLTAPAMADSIASSASSAGSASVGSISDSFRGSSNSSSGDDPKVAEGDYRIVEIAALDDASGRQRLRLQGTAAGAGAAFDLLLPLAARTDGPLQTGDVLHVAHRVYGLAVARAGAAEPFYLVLDDRRHRELEARAVSL